MTDYQDHPIAALFPMMSDEEFAAFKDDTAMDRTTQRTCLRCTKPFPSLGPENRVCRRCEKRVQEIGGVQVRVVGLARPREVGYRLTEVKR